jgi:uncharacterized protein
LKQLQENMSEQLKLRYVSRDFPTMFLDRVVVEACATEAFRRLRDISFLGAVEKNPRMLRHNRFDHSVGVAYLAQYYATKIGLSEESRRTVVLAALLHDIGHAPLSHSLEPLFVKEFGLDHHLATRKLLKGSVGLGLNLAKLLKQNKVDVDEILHLMSGHSSCEKGRIFSSPINVDTIEAIWRGGSYLNRRFFNPTDVLDAFIRLDMSDWSKLDSFWRAKNTFYQLMIYSKSGIEADHWARVRVQNSPKGLHPDDYYTTERWFLANRVCSNKQLFPSTVTIKTREFDVNSEETLNSYACFSKRFTVTKTNKEVELDVPREGSRDCFQSSMF